MPQLILFFRRKNIMSSGLFSIYPGSPSSYGVHAGPRETSANDATVEAIKNGIEAHESSRFYSPLKEHSFTAKQMKAIFEKASTAGDPTFGEVVKLLSQKEPRDHKTVDLGQTLKDAAQVELNHAGVALLMEKVSDFSSKFFAEFSAIGDARDAAQESFGAESEMTKAFSGKSSIVIIENPWDRDY